MQREGTTTTPPRAQIFIKRPRLTKLLDESGARITLLLAPAGYGKTTLAREWTDEQGHVGWYLGAPAMIDVAGLSVGIAEVLNGMRGEPRAEMVERVRILAARGHDPRGLAKAVSSGSPGSEALLIVDDYHHALGSEDAEAFLEELVALTKFRLLITSRDRPSWLPARKVVYGEAAVVEMDALAFTDEEALAVLGETGSGILAEARGWPAVIGLAAVRGEAIVAASGLQGDDLYEFFAEDLFRSAPPPLRDAMFLMALAGVDGARALLGPGYVELVEQAAERGFLAGADRQVVHPLLRSFLLTKLRELDDAKRDGVVASAVEHLAQQHRWDDCLFVLERFPNDELILSTLERGLAEMLDSGRVATAKNWVALATRQRISNPIFLLAEAEVALRERDDLRAQAVGQAAGLHLSGDMAARAYLVASRAAHLRSSSKDARRLAELVVDRATSDSMRSQGLWAAFHSAREYVLADAEDILARLDRMTGLGSSHSLRLSAAHAFVLCDTRRVSEAIQDLELANVSISVVPDPFARTSALQSLAFAYMVAARYEDSLATVDRQISEADETGLAFVIDHARLRQAGANIGLRRFGEAIRALSDLKRRSTSVSSFINENVVLQEAKLSIATGDLRRARSILSRSFGGDPRPAFCGELASYRSLVAAAMGDLESADGYLSEDEDSFRFAEAASLRDISRAIASVKRRDRPEVARDIIMTLLRRGEADAVVTGIRACPELIQGSATDRASSQALTNLLMRARDFDIAKSAGLNPPREARPRGRLSPREHEVLELLAQGHTNQEIGRALFISESTTKVHVRHILEKLGARSRAEAARIAAALDLA
jgi:ATP/maltotriose-dependent transcriptional regulator MalT